MASTSHTTLQSAHAGPSRALHPANSDPGAVQNRDVANAFRFHDRHVLHVLLQACRFHFEDYMSEAACERFLAEERQKLTQLGNRFGFQTSIMLKNIPASMSTVTRRLGLDCVFQEQAACPKCWTLYEAIPDTETWAKQKLHLTVTSRCTARFFTTARSLSTSAEQIRKCDEPVFKEFMVSGKPAWRPIKGFCYQKLHDWLKRKLIQPEFEDLIDAPLRYTRQDGVMRDIWDGSVWNTLKFPSTNSEPYASTSGNLVFSLYVDWFNPHGNKVGGKCLEAGAITLVCLNLPPAERYLEENIFLFGITPGQPSADHIFNVLQPLVDEFLTFLNGVHFDQTSRFPTGQTIRAIMLPLIADLPALRKVAGFASHSATLFCSFCKLPRSKINIIDPQQFPPRKHEDHIEWARKWLDSPDRTRKTAIVKEQGVRYSPLNELPYWKPLEHSSIDVMHALMLGVLKDHSLSYLGLAVTGKKLEADLKKLANKQPSVKATVFEVLLERKTASKKHPAEEDEHPSKRRLTTQNLQALADTSEQVLISANPRVASSSRGSQASLATVHQYTLRARLSNQKTSQSSQATANPRKAPSRGSRQSHGESMASEVETNNEDDSIADRHVDDHMPSLLPEELLCVRRAIEQTSLPSWVDRLPLQLGAASAGSLKAAEWGILYAVFYPLVLLPLWNLCDANEDRKILSENLVKLVHIVHMLSHCTITNDNVSSISEAIQQYRKHTLANWPSVKSKPNIHLLQHFPGVIERFGPPASFAAWAQERLNGLLGKAKTNNHPGTLSKTLFRRWIQRATLKRLNGITDMNHEEGTQGAKPTKSPTPIEAEIYDEWLDYLNTYPPYSSTNWVRDTPGVDQSHSTIVEPMAILLPCFKDAQKKNYTVETGHAGNSYIHFTLEGKDLFGSIQTLFATEQCPNAIFARVSLFLDVDQKGPRIDPYSKISSLHYRLLARPKTPKTIVICIKHIIGHVAVLSNVSGVFGIDIETISVAIVHHLVRGGPGLTSSRSLSHGTVSESCNICKKHKVLDDRPSLGGPASCGCLQDIRTGPYPPSKFPVWTIVQMVVPSNPAHVVSVPEPSQKSTAQTYPNILNGL
ncbi:hypothetical protein MJO28_000858 [Puccinia striiformis f. sp. tritici]|uniref:Uncharacterized protein n=1 Tax=Puccinia striiformis f. sp. tritici TaxID=168172 RepID=A0ACC0F0Z8_9BASI|nr:hypothetical protein MJO28_000858 [Puccinia striiformis f. sp. tritici]